MTADCDARSTTRPVLIGFDGSEPSRQALAWAVRYAAARRLPLSVIAVWDWPTVLGAPVSLTGYDPEHELRESIRRDLKERSIDPDQVAVKVERGSAAKVLTAATHDAELLVVGSRGLGGFARLSLGSVSAQCLAHASCPVVIIPGDASLPNDDE